MTTGNMGNVRPLVENDLPGVIDLHHRAFGNWKACPPEVTRSHFENVFLRHPWLDASMPSLVHQDREGRITGCLGSLRRPAWFRGKPIQMAVSHNFMVDPLCRSTLAGVELLKAYFCGPQDLSIAEGNLASRKVWEALGGATALGDSFSWVRPFRPLEQVCLNLDGPGLRRLALAPVRLLSRLVDGMAARLPGTPFRPVPPGVDGEDLSEEVFLARLPEFTRRLAIQPRYDAASLKWLFEFLMRKNGHGTLRRTAVKDKAGRLLGWHIYYSQPGGRSQVLQVVADSGTVARVLGHLIHDAWQQGAVCLSGKVVPGWIEHLSDKAFLFSRSLSWSLVQARDPALVLAVLEGDAFLTRLEGEWWIAH